MAEKRKRIQVPSDAHTVFHFQLPYAIPVQDGRYQIRLAQEIVEIDITRIQRTDTSWKVSPGAYLQFRNDKYGKSSFSQIIMKIPRLINIRETGRTPKFINAPPRFRGKEILLRFLNRFIDCVKYVTGEYWVEPARYQDILSYKLSFWDGEKLIPASTVIFDTGTGGIGVGNVHPFNMDDTSLSELNRILLNEEKLESSRLLLLSSKDACLQEDFKLAIIEAVTALEVVLYRFIREKGKEKSIDTNTIDRFIIDVGLTGNITVVLRMLVDDLSEIDDFLSICRGAIRIRNKILHEGFMDLTATDNEERVSAIEQLIEFIQRH